MTIVMQKIINGIEEILNPFNEAALVLVHWESNNRRGEVRAVWNQSKEYGMHVLMNAQQMLNLKNQL